MNGGGRGRGRGRGRGGADPNANIPPPPPPPQFDVAQLMAMQTQILQGMAAALANLQAQQNQSPPPPPPQPRDKHMVFMSHRPPTYSNSTNPLQADDWLKAVEKMLDITQCNDREKVLYAFGKLEGSTADWWDSYTCLLYTSPSPRDGLLSRMPSSA